MKNEMSGAIYEKLMEFNTKINTLGVVSKSDVLSLEGIMGAAIITSAININRFTELDSAVCINDVKEVIKEAVAGAKINDVITYDVFMRKLLEVRPVVSRLFDLFRDLSKISQDTLDRFMNEQYVYSYVNGANEEINNVTNVAKDISVFEALRWRKDYIAAVLNTTAVGTRSFDAVYSDFDRYFERHDTNTDFIAMPLLNIILDNGIDNIMYNGNPTFRQITIEDMCKFIGSIDLHIDKLLKVEARIDSDIKMYKSDIGYYGNSEANAKYIKDTYDQYDNMIKMLSDNSSLLVLKVLGNFA